MNNIERRSLLLQVLKDAAEPTTGNELSKNFGVTRQVIVADVSVLRAEGAKIIATPQGYILYPEEGHSMIQRQIAAHHSENMQEITDELFTIVDHGGTVVNVIVEHPLYGEITANLQLKSRHDVQKFAQSMTKLQAEPLLVLTDGLHLHTIEAASEEILDRVVEELKEKGYLVKE